MSAITKAREIFESAGHDVEVIPTPGPNTAGDLARRAVENGAALVLAAGGDGTLNEVAGGMIGSNVPLGVLPAGTANVLAHETGMPTNPVKAARCLASWEPRRIAAGRVNGRPFLLMAGVGLDAHVVYHIDAGLKSAVGKAAYWISAFSLVGRELEEFEVTVDGARRICSFALVSRVRNYGGDLEIARRTSLLDDQFEVVLFEGRKAARYLKYFVGVAARRLAGMEGVTLLRAGRVDLCCPESRKVYVQVDGEYAGRLPATIEIVPDALTLLLPRDYVRSRASEPANQARF